MKRWRDETNEFKDGLCDTRDDTLELRIVHPLSTIGTHHGVRFTTRSLSVHKDCAVVPIENVSEDGFRHRLVNLCLRACRWEHLIKIVRVFSHLKPLVVCCASFVSLVADKHKGR